jgi:VanZ family protein
MKEKEISAREFDETDCWPALVLSRSKVVSWLLVLGWMVVIFCFSAQANSGHETGKYLGQYNIMVRKCSHVFEFAVLFLLIRRAWVVTFKTGRLGRIATLASAVIAILYAATDEWHQSYVPGRSATFDDVLVDCCGVFLAWGIWLAICKLSRSSTSRT